MLALTNFIVIIIYAARFAKGKWRFF